MVSLSSLKLELDQYGQGLSALRRRVDSLESARASSREEWEHEKHLVFEAVKAHVGTVISSELGAARQAIEAEMAKVNAVLLRLEKTGSLGTLEHLVNLLADPVKVALLRDAIDEQTFARMAAKKKAESHADITLSLDVREKRLKPWQIAVGIVATIVTALAGLAALSHVVH